MSTETVGLLGTGALDGNLDFHEPPELCKWTELKWLDTIRGIIGSGADHFPCGIHIVSHFWIRDADGDNNNNNNNR